MIFYNKTVGYYNAGDSSKSHNPLMVGSFGGVGTCAVRRAGRNFSQFLQVFQKQLLTY